MVEFLKNWKLGINAFFIILNIQNPKFDAGIQQMMKLINDFFNNPNFWNQTGIVFTRCYPGYFDRKMAETLFRKKVIDYIRTFPDCESINPQMPCFFVDSVKWETDQNTKNEYIRMFEYSHKNNPVPTQNLQIVDPDCQNKVEEILEKQLISSEKNGEGINAVKTYYYEDQKRYVITDWKGNVRYSDHGVKMNIPKLKKNIKQKIVKIVLKNLELKNVDIEDIKSVVQEEQDKFMIIMR